jgi:hypothetical protein
MWYVFPCSVVGVGVNGSLGGVIGRLRLVMMDMESFIVMRLR